MDPFPTVYRGYDIQIVGKHASWSFRARPQRPESPILSQAVLSFYASREAALTAAKKRVDHLLTNYP